MAQADFLVSLFQSTSPSQAAADPYLDIVDRLLFDARPPRRPDAPPGGNGLVFDWRLTAGRRHCASLT